MGAGVPWLGSYSCVVVGVQVSAAQSCAVEHAPVVVWARESVALAPEESLGVHVHCCLGTCMRADEDTHIHMQLTMYMQIYPSPYTCGTHIYSIGHSKYSVRVPVCCRCSYLCASLLASNISFAVGRSIIFG